ncbi:ankyrin repeat domain-containing protein 26-like isoform X2 [Tupaia chinensis]|uniref:ankyrin repeat domain-containing protein 26-like isoform X2 n=1 Tax=Tupaia chinensis TaxID=246437 RepID=UPI000FFC1DDB|nr:ankyrin repeat domain-containing protein 26-like isoform X2 [Tupaia chinensis]
MVDHQNCEGGRNIGKRTRHRLVVHSNWLRTTDAVKQIQKKKESPKMTSHLMPTLEEKDSVPKKAGGVEDVQTPRPELDLQMTPEEEQERLDGSAEREPKADERRKKQSSNEMSISEILCDGAAAPAGEDGRGVFQQSAKADALLIPTKEHEEHDGSTKTTSKEKKEISDSRDREKRSTGSQLQVGE